MGALAIYLGVVASIAAMVARPLMRLMIKTRTESGAGFFLAGACLSPVSGIGALGVFPFEFSRLHAAVCTSACCLRLRDPRCVHSSELQLGFKHSGMRRE